MILIFIYHFKSILSITDIQALLNPLTEKYFDKKDGITIERIYTEVFSMEDSQVEALKDDIRQQYKLASQTFPEAEGEEAEFLQIFSFIPSLSVITRPAIRSMPKSSSPGHMGQLGPARMVYAFLDSSRRWGRVLLTKVLAVIITTSHWGISQSQAESG